MSSRILLALFLVASSTVYSAPADPGAGGHVPLPGQPPVNLLALKPLAGVTGWETFAKVEQLKQGDKMVPKFGGEISALDSKDIKLQGFMLPLDMTEKQQHFILSATPPTCAFCLPSGPDQLVEVYAATPVRFSYEPVLISGKLSLLRADPSGLLYRIIGAAPAKP